MTAAEQPPYGAAARRGGFMPPTCGILSTPKRQQFQTGLRGSLIGSDETQRLILMDSIVELSNADAQFGGGFLAIAVMARQGGENQFALHVIDGSLS